MGNTTTHRSELGSVREYRRGKWRARIAVGTRIDGKPDVRSKVFGSEREAWDWIRTESVRLRSKRAPRGITFKQLWEIYERNRLPELAATTRKAYLQRAKGLIRRFGDTDISSIRCEDFQAYLDTLTPSMAQKASTTMSAALTYATKHGMLDENPLYRAPKDFGESSRYASADDEVWDDDPFAAIESKRDVWDVRTAIDCAERIRGLALEPVYLACVGAGLRVSEAFALRKMDVRRIVASYDELGREIWVTQLAVHHATTRDESRKSTKNAHSVGIVPMLEPFGERYWELACACEDRHETICKLSAARQNKTWRTYFEKPPEEWHKRMSDDRKVQGRLYGLPYIPLSRMRATNTTICQENGVLDSINQHMHRNTGAVQQRHYMRPDTTEAAIKVSRRIS
ncbi:MAG: hypothetical protein IKE22_07565 [Atopobiaceae bacterium]|nr:hypothetical protein [Atopobiaceae bacterium]